MSSFNRIPAVLPQLPYPYNALEPHVELHHSKHHATYVANFNKAHEDIQAASQAQDIKKQIALQAAIKFNGGGHINHTLFWENLAPQSQGGGQFPSSGKLHDQVQQDFGGLDGLKKAVNAAALGIQGSGWAWLGYNPTTKKLEAVSTANQDPLLGYVPLVGIDMWEHAYYIDYASRPFLFHKNVKASYLDNIWSVINWQTAEKRLAEA
ncbi:hypothetical protein Rt10032_c02g0788 [Rhodotorula toruloides]|uniref:Superoxide dismutase n=1 Tax=Rhodotorula toruloides TaxID=5286 RepID=A0A511K8V2_RHOTO|nr:hypothetical protein Rt10032_c02g0788 [Rhodotorula toruloides]